ncbi:MAG TPA: dihydroorotase [Lacibacter sp.]|nr:dihydroorotase [Lacibacter sp.]HMO89700.1 dihydroorotase [Lacibacter sp.]
MTILIRQAQIIDPSSPYHLTRQDIWIRDGRISQIGGGSATADKVVETAGHCVSPGWVDIFSHFCDPGLEHKETLESGMQAAAAGGYTEVMVLPNTQPVISGKSQVEYIVQKTKDHAVRVHPLGAVSKQAEGKDLAEMYDMHAAGAIAFTDGLRPVQSAGLLLKALQYVKSLGVPIIQLPDDESVGRHGLVNEGIVSTRLGIPGKPALAEEILVQRDIQLAAYTGSKLHLTGVTTPRSLELVAAARQAGIDVTCSVSPAHLFFCDEDLQGYDTNLKLVPPLRTAADRAALRQAVLDGTVDCIASHHLPHEYDSKTCEFEYAKPGMIGLETAYGVTGAALGKDLTPERWVELVCHRPRNIFGLPVPVVEVGAEANLTLFHPSHTHTFTADRIRSRSHNTAFTGRELPGRVTGIIRNQFLIQNN